LWIGYERRTKMTGVEILAVQEVVTAYAFNWTAFWITASIVFGLLLATGLVSSIVQDYWGILIFCIVLAIFLTGLFGLLIGEVLAKPTEYETQYKVIISDEVPMNDFLDKYEIVDQDGKIYTVRERCGVEDGK
jgi:hypothetical protein